jgi:hypothetical protein
MIWIVAPWTGFIYKSSRLIKSCENSRIFIIYRMYCTYYILVVSYMEKMGQPSTNHKTVKKFGRSSCIYLFKH